MILATHEGMKRKLLTVWLFSLFVACSFLPERAEGDDRPSSSPYSLGNQVLSINAGLFIPLFLVGGNPSLGSTNLTVGGVGSIDWGAYVSPHVRIGASIGGTFTFDPNYTALLMIPIVVKASYLFELYPWEIPLTLGLGMNVLKYSSDSTIDFLIRPGTGLWWSYNSSWSFGVNLNYWWDTQFTRGTLTGGWVAANFIEVSIGALYHF